MAITVSVRELRNSTATVIRQLEAGVEVTLTNRGRPVALLTPLTAATRGRELLDRLDRLEPSDTGLDADIARWRLEEADAESEDT